MGRRGLEQHTLARGEVEGHGCGPKPRGDERLEVARVALLRSTRRDHLVLVDGLSLRVGLGLGGGAGVGGKWLRKQRAGRGGLTSGTHVALAKQILKHRRARGSSARQRRQDGLAVEGVVRAERPGEVRLGAQVEDAERVELPFEVRVRDAGLGSGLSTGASRGLWLIAVKVRVGVNSARTPFEAASQKHMRMPCVSAETRVRLESTGSLDMRSARE